MANKKVIVIGGGASGLMAAGTAAESGADVILLEKMTSPARKIKITGKGRCNLSNSAELDDFISHFGQSGRFLRQAFGDFFTGDLIDFFTSKGLQLTIERGGRIFPEHADAPAVARLLINWVKKNGVDVQTGAIVTNLLIKNQRLVGVICNGRKIYGDRIILATGGKSYPRTGSTGDGYQLAQTIGHTLVPVRPALVPLKTNKDNVTGLAGLHLRNVKARLFVDKSRKQQVFGELNFTNDGLDGPIILTLSSVVVDAMRAKKQVVISLDLKPALDDKKLEARLLRDLSSRAREPMASVLRGLLPRQLIPICLVHADIDPTQEASQLPAKARKKMRQWLKDLRFEIVGYGSYNQAIITAGGIKTTEIHPKTMESRIAAGLYIVGELLDIQADTGGYNLQAAFTTGWVAGRAAAAA
ncbi:MAG: NAD(P)/FAD-dependent oxidoreductase [Deltaproteobacteria bacterium]|nr:NAD(P)/FAD-dependent oxidoreductase [Deltaproteobacteria bacterium]